MECEYCKIKMQLKNRSCQKEFGFGQIYEYPDAPVVEDYYCTKCNTIYRKYTTTDKLTNWCSKRL